jgi:hypothetical protein
MRLRFISAVIALFLSLSAGGAGCDAGDKVPRSKGGNCWVACDQR